MKVKDLIGKKIKGFDTEIVEDHVGKNITHIRSILLENNLKITFGICTLKDGPPAIKLQIWYT